MANPQIGGDCDAGHGGSSASEYLSTMLPEFLAHDSQLRWDPEGALVRALAHVEKTFTQRALSSRDRAGSCVCVCLLVGNTAILANIGDCRAVLVGRGPRRTAVKFAGSVSDVHDDDSSDGGRSPAFGSFTPNTRRRVADFLPSAPTPKSQQGVWALRLTVDHKPNSPSELTRIESCGAHVRRRRLQKATCLCLPGKGFYEVGPHRVEPGGLAVSRAIGDVLHKSGRSKRPGAIIATPETSSHELDASADVCIVIASDGLWDHISPESSVFTKCVMQSISRAGKRDAIVAEERARRARRRRGPAQVHTDSAGITTNPAAIVSANLVDLALTICKDKARQDNVTVACLYVCQGAATSS